MPTVSVIIPCYNEQATICLLLAALYQQTYPRPELEVIIVDGLSSDHTRSEIAAFQSTHSDLLVRVIDNPRRSIPAALNQGLSTAVGVYLIRLDAHSIPYPNYIARCIANLEQDLGDNVGGIWEIRPGGKSWLARAIAVAAAHPLGVGDAHYRLAAHAGAPPAQATDTVPFFAFRRALLDKIGTFNENLLTNEDYEFNTRIRQAGGTIWLDPEIRSVYIARSTLGALARQYGRYGFWKAQMLSRYPKTIRWRQALPPGFVFSLIILTLLSVWLPLAFQIFIPLWFLAFQIGCYAAVLIGVGFQLALKKKDWTLLIGAPLAISAMHLAWGAAFLWGLLNPNKAARPETT